MSLWHDRGAWQNPLQPVTGPEYSPTSVDTVVIHYTAAANLPDGDLNEFGHQIPPYLRSIQNDYVRNRGYSIGYNAAVDWLGGAWELRGFDYRCAANSGHNLHTFAILVLVDGADGATPEAAAKIREIVAEVHRRANRIVGVVGHGRLPGAATACPGRGLLEQIDAGLFDPTTPPPAPPPPIEIPDPLEELMSLAAVIVAVDGDPTRAEALAVIDPSTGVPRLVGFNNPTERDDLVALGVKRQSVTATRYDRLVQRSLSGR